MAERTVSSDHPLTGTRLSASSSTCTFNPSAPSTTEPSTLEREEEEKVDDEDDEDDEDELEEKEAAVVGLEGLTVDEEVEGGVEGVYGSLGLE
jgi:hypothetical protein